MADERGTLGIISAMSASRRDGMVCIHFSFGRVIDRLAAVHERTLLCVPLTDEHVDTARDYCIRGNNVKVLPQPFYRSTFGALKHVAEITRSYFRTCREADVLFIRGMVPYVGILYAAALVFRLKPCHWIVGNPVALLRTHRRAGRVKDLLSVIYALHDRVLTQLGRWITGGSFICNGQELGDIFRSPRTVVTVSSTVTEDEFFERTDTCQGGAIKILFVGFIRPEKGVEYLIEAVSKLRIDRPWELVLVGTRGKYDEYGRKLDALIDRLGIADRVGWRGYVPYGEEMFRLFREADIFVLPTLSEGTPRVLVEARANSVPTIASRVGGIPTSITDGKDGLLVPPKDAQALAAAISRIVSDGAFRRSLIRSGLKTARTMTIERFVDVVTHTL